MGAELEAISQEGGLGVPNQVGVMAVIAGVFVAAIAGGILRRRADRRAYQGLQELKRFSVEVIRSSERLLKIASEPGTSGGPSSAAVLQDNPQFRAAVRGLATRTSSPQVRAALAELEQARLQVLVAAVASEPDYLQNAVRGLCDAIEAFSSASSIMIRLAPVSAGTEVI